LEEKKETCSKPKQWELLQRRGGVTAQRQSNRELGNVSAAKKGEPGEEIWKEPFSKKKIACGGVRAEGDRLKGGK